MRRVRGRETCVAKRRKVDTRTWICIDTGIKTGGNDGEFGTRMKMWTGIGMKRTRRLGTKQGEVREQGEY